MKPANIGVGSEVSSVEQVHGERVAAMPVPPVGAGETIVLLTWNAKPRTGRLHRLLSGEGIVSYSPLDGDEVHEVALAGIKAVHVHGAGVSGVPAGEDQEDRDLLSEERDFQIEFRDGDRLSGRTAGFCADNGGVYLFPIGAGLDSVCTFVPHASATSVHVGPPLGEVLVDEGLVEAEDVAAALAAQKARREEPLGAALARRGAVTIMEIEKALEQQRDLPHLKIGEILIEEGLVDSEQLDKALAAQGEDRTLPLGKLLVQLGMLTEEKLDRAIARKLGIPSVDLRRFHIDQAALAIVPEDIVFKFRVVPLYAMGTRLVVAVADPLDWQPIEAVSFATGRQVVPVVANAREITRVIDLAYSSCSDEEITRAHDNIVSIAPEPDAQSSKVSHSDNLVVKLVNKIIVGAYHEGASDIHIEPGRAAEAMNVRIRKEGELRSLLKVPPRLHRAVIARLKVMASLDVTERRRPQDGRIDMRQFGQIDADLRIATVPTVGGLEDVIIRILSSTRPVAVSNLGLTPSNQDRLVEMLERPSGLLLVCGPTGSGKTTTLHALLARLNTEDRKIWTAEDPVEITQPGLRQVQVSPETGMTFAAAIRAFLRADPDLIMFGEMRDEETTRVAIEASLTGHLVMSTIHTNSATETIVRLLDMGMDPFNFADALGGLLAQRLVKRLCRACKEPNVASSRKISELLSEYCAPFASASAEGAAMRERELERWATQFSNMEGEFKLYRAVGCEECGGTGYDGRLGVHELFIASEGTKSLIRRSAPVSDLRALAIAEGMRTLKQDGIEKVLYGLTDMRQVRAACPD